MEDLYCSKFSYEGLLELCNRYRQDIYDRKPIEKVLEGRLVRFVAPNGKFDYTTFGNFYFTSMGVMMLITTDSNYTCYHCPDELSNTLLSTVPVYFAGVGTGVKDDSRQEIFTGDVVTAKEKGITSLVRYLCSADQPSLAGDNCDLMFSMCDKGLHIEGTAFCDLDKSLLEIFDPHVFFWPTSQFSMGGMSKDEVIEKAAKVKNRPSFNYPIEKKKGNAVIYEGSAVERAKKMEGAVITYLVNDEYEDPLDEDTYAECFLNESVEYDGEEHRIKIDQYLDGLDRFKQGFEEFMLYAHRKPEKKFVLCDFMCNSLNLKKSEAEAVAMLLYPLYENNIRNVIVPRWIGMAWINYDCIHNAPCD